MSLQRIALLGALSSLSLAQDSALWFEEKGAALGLDWEHVAGARDDRHWFPEIMGGGVALVDFDGDGDLDVYLIQSGRLDPQEGEVVPTNKLYRNDLPVTNPETGELMPWRFVDVTDKTKVGDTGYGMGVACGDFDQDGDVDIYVTNVGENVFYVNDGRGRFKNDARMKGNDARWGTSAGFLDVDLDDDLDIFLVNNLNWEVAVEKECVNYRKQVDYCSPENYNAHSTDGILLLGRLGYQDAAARVGLPGTPANGLGLAIADYDRDGDLDVYVANDATPNALWRNDGGRSFGKGENNGFTDVAPSSLCAVNAQGTPEAGMGVQWVDIDQDGWLDLYMTHLRKETNTFYRNGGKGSFRDMTTRMGVAQASVKYTGFGVGFHDFDHDGYLDFYVANGAVQAWGVDEQSWFAEPDAEGKIPEGKVQDTGDRYAEPNQLFRGKGKVKFDYLGEGTASPVIGTSRGAAFGDLDNDGAVDIVVVDRDARVKLLHNVAPKEGGFVGLTLKVGRGANSQGALAKLTTVTQDAEGAITSTRVQWRLAHPAYSYLSSNDPRVHFGVPAGEVIGKLEVIWPGTTEPVEVAQPGLNVYSVITKE